MNFDWVAPVYRALETLVFGNALQRARTAFISQLADRRQALLAGEGNGRFLARAHAAFPALRIDCVDASEAMLSLSRRQAEENVRLIHRDLRTWDSPAGYDVIVTHFFLDCFSEQDLNRVINKLNAAAAEKARWLISEFTLPPGRFARPFARVLIAIMYAFFRVTAGINGTHLIDYRPLLVARGFSRAEEQLFYFGMVKAECWER